ncbi:MULTISPECIES: PG0541 family transporter-associated protein [unclassified Fusobacterium]|uniref:PG0541 family transporter-associated protein n=1 Tax=unclassified Fusobacterium TaxID=2648384 RepID=UPI0025BD7B67|nr:PG0541 family transporter-associated protein [Fusobacterium sp.]
MNNFQNYKMMMVYINESHKVMLEDFLEEIHFHLYTVQRKAESVWNEKIKHKNTHIWPGTDCIFLLSLPGEKVEHMLKMLKTFRASLPYEIVMAIGVIPLERTVPDLLKEKSVEIDTELLERLKNKKDKK